MQRFFVVVLALGFIFVGCAKRTITAQPEQAGEQPAAQKAGAEASGDVAGAAKAGSEKIGVVPVKEAEAREEKPGAAFGNIYFDFDRYDIRDDAKPTLKSTSDWLLKNKTSKMVIEGHCDERGTNEYNLALGEKRAKAARDYIVSMGVTKDRLDIISYGEEKPVCKEQNEECWQKNRRAQFIVK